MNTEQHEEQQVEVESTHPGQVLKNARIALGLTEQDVADRLRLRISVIRELEENCCDDNQIATFTRGYIRSYAKLVGLDAGQLLKNFQPTPQAEDNAQKMQSFSRKTRREQHDSRVMGLTWVILAAAVGITSFWWWQNQQKETRPVAPETTTAEVVQVLEPSFETVVPDTDVLQVESDVLADVDASTTDALEDLPETVTANAEPAPEIVDDDDDVTTIASDDTNAAVAVSEPVEQAVVSVPTLSLSFDGDCWVDIRDGSGKRLLTGIKSAGETVDLSGQAPFKIVLGAPTAVNVEFNGEKVDLSGYPSGRVARLTLPE